MALRNNDKRRAPRARHDSVVELFDDAGKLVDTGRLVDFSDTGAAFFSLKPLRKGDKVKLRVRLLERGVLDICAAVVWARDSGPGRLYGLRFEEKKDCFPTGERKRPLEDK